jgi:hypothetical protein
VLTGVVGHIKWHYYTAAAINGYTVRRTKAGAWSLTATVVLSDAFKMAQRPLTFIAKHAKGEWRFAIDSHTLVDHRLTAKLQPPEK